MKGYQYYLSLFHKYICRKCSGAGLAVSEKNGAVLPMDCKECKGTGFKEGKIPNFLKG